jgi:hypothetical protein
VTTAKRFLILVHRYLGIALSALFVLWFASGIAMIYTGGMPELTPAERIARLPELDLDGVRIDAREGAEIAGFEAFSDHVALRTILDRPAYVFDAGPFSATVFADTGTLLTEGSPARSRGVAARFLGIADRALEFVGTITQPDQWTLTVRRELPLHKFSTDSGAEVYVSPATAEVVVATTPASRWRAWLGPIPHWLYFAPLRANQTLWYGIVVGLASLGCMLAALGLVLAVTQFRVTRPFRLAAAIRYTGWMRWHYLLGVVFGVFALTWVFSGLLSMEPFEWTRQSGIGVDRNVVAGGPVELGRFPALDARAWRRLLDREVSASVPERSRNFPRRQLKQIEFRGLAGAPHYLATYTTSAEAEAPASEHLQTERAARERRVETLLVVADDRELRERTKPFETDTMLERLATALPDVEIARHELVADYDDYYYSRDRDAPLPVLRVELTDPGRTWLYIDPRLGRLVAEVDAAGRVDRWLYNGLHSLDFAFWYDRRPLWDVGVVALCSGALVTSLIGFCLGMKRLFRPRR